jgi:predicted ABC-type ATPase
LDQLAASLFRVGFSSSQQTDDSIQHIERVVVRAAQGGHSVPEEVIRRRFKQGWRNFKNIYRELVDSWELYDNSGERAELIEEG